MRVFVTGGTGLIGTRLVRRLRERGDEVLVLTRRPDSARERFGAVGCSPGSARSECPKLDRAQGFPRVRWRSRTRSVPFLVVKAVGRSPPC